MGVLGSGFWFWCLFLQVWRLGSGNKSVWRRVDSHNLFAQCDNVNPSIFLFRNGVKIKVS